VKTDAEVAALADRLTRAIESGDETLQREVFSENFRVWHNTDREELELEAAIGFIANLRSRCSSVTYSDLRRTPTPTGYVQEATISGVTNAGKDFASPACIVVEVGDDDRIRSVREYQDSAQLAPLFEND
jgi:uncharacterized protein